LWASRPQVHLVAQTLHEHLRRHGRQHPPQQVGRAASGDGDARLRRLRQDGAVVEPPLVERLQGDARVRAAVQEDVV
jgi:hypothetical protein